MIYYYYIVVAALMMWLYYYFIIVLIIIMFFCCCFLQENLFGYLVLSLKFEVSSKKRKTKGNLYAKLQEAQQLQCKTGDGIFARCCMLPLGFFPQ